MGENGFGSSGLMRGAFSVGVAGGGVVVVVVVVVSGASSPSVVHPAVTATIANTAVTPTPARTRRGKLG
ncbi:hypothetical protein QGN32_08995 [Mycolicibacterium sp. ND9-15]|uniref:hypothetical protein n=1 Tax=Mycolicibacterium sp. ND9-15 TaxID=3042320 RepID=UPI002DDB5DBF|nr:hypothetical protein [Mycolicibacterium sp. ND9-15]WSE57963.1 hypothetical protein QGN32_08995 [Mycolicibacterium sp. ND9-15]